MPTLKDMYQALEAADAAGAGDDAREIAQMIHSYKIAQNPTLESKEETSDFIRGLKSYLPQTKETFGGAQSILGVGSEKVFGKNPISNYLIEHGVNNLHEANKEQETLSKPYDSFSQAWDQGIGTVLMNYVPYQVGQAAGNIMETGATSLAGAALGSAAGPEGTAAGALTGLVGKSLVKKGIKEAAEKVLEKEGKEAAAKYVAAETEKFIASEAGRKAINKQIGSYAGSSGQALFHGLGEPGSRAVETAEEAGGTARNIDLSKLAVAVPLHSVADLIGQRIGLGALDGLAKPTKNLLLDISKGMIATGAKEIPPELFQTSLERYGANLPLTDKQAIKEYIDTAGAAFVMGALPGSVGPISSHLTSKNIATNDTGEEQPTNQIAPTANAGTAEPVTNAGIAPVEEAPRTTFAPPIQPPAPPAETQVAPPATNAPAAPEAPVSAPIAATPPATPAPAAAPLVEPTPPSVPPEATATPPAVPPVVPTSPPSTVTGGGGVEQNRDRSRDAYVTQMNDIANKLDYDRVGVEPRMTGGAPIVTGPVQIPQNQLGKVSNAIAENGHKMPVQYAVVEAKDILASHNADGTVNPQYKPDFQGLRSVVGNGRTAGLQAAYVRGTAEDYRNRLINDDAHGVDKSVIEGMKNPVLVRYTEPSAIPANIGDISNTPGTLELSVVEQARNDANRVDLDKLKFGDDGEITNDTVRDFVKRMPASERNKLIDNNGSPTRIANERMKAAIFHMAYGDDALTHLAHEKIDEESKNIFHAISEAAPQMAALPTSGEMDIRPALVDAVRTAVNARRNGIKLSDMLKQQDMTANPLTTNILKLFADNSRSSKKIAESLKGLATKINEEASAPTEDLFGTRERQTLQQIIDEHFPAAVVEVSSEEERKQALSQLETSLSVPVPAFRAKSASRTQLLKPTPLTKLEQKEIFKLASDAIDLGMPAALLGNVTAAGKTRMDSAAIMSQSGWLMLAKQWPKLSSSKKLHTLIHELGHSVDYVTGNPSNSTNWSKAHAELQNWYDNSSKKSEHPLAYPFAPQYKGQVRPKEESFAQAFAYYFTSPADLQTNAPEAYSQIESIIERIKNESSAARARGTTKAGTAGIKIQPSRGGQVEEVRSSTGQVSPAVSENEGNENRSARQVNDVQFFEDIPSEKWLEGKIESALRSPRNEFGVPKMSSITGYFKSPVMIPARWLKNVKGQRGEEKNVRQKDLAAIRKIIRDTGKFPLNDNGTEYVPYIEIGYDGKPWISEGNHRVMAAIAEGMEYIPVELRYFDGGQRRAGVWGPGNVASITERLAGEKSIEINPSQSSQEENNVEQLTKTTKAQTSGQAVKQAATQAWNNVQSSNYRTGLRVAWIDKNSGLTKSLESQPTFDSHGQLRADMLARTQDQVINLINNGLQTGTPSVNSDGTIGIERSENNLARSQIIADKLDGKIMLDGKRLSGRDAVAEVARMLRGKDILAEDAKRRQKGAEQRLFAKELIKLAKVARDPKSINPETNKPYTLKEIQEILNGAKYMRREALKNVNMNRELQVKPEGIQWAESQLAAHPELQQVLDIWKKVNDSLVTLWEDTGLFTKQQADRYRANENYVPLFKSREDLEKDPNGFGGTGAKTVKGIKELQGSMARRNIWENVDKHYAAMVASAYQNQTRKVATSQLKALGLAEMTKSSDPAVNLRYRDPTSEFADANGIVSAVIANPNDLAAFQMMHYELGPIMKMMSATTKVLRVGALVNPMYWIKQLMRDSVHSTITTDSGIVTPFHSAKEFINIIAGNSEEMKILASRGVVGQLDSTIDLHDFLKQAGKERRDPNTMQKMLHKVMQMHEASDAATRISIYKNEYAKAKANGMSEAHAVNYAVHKARESINFSARGNSPTLNTLRHMVPFLSAAITSLDTVYRAATGHGKSKEEAAQARKIFIQRATMMAVLCTAYAMAYQNDDDYKDLPDHVKDNNFLIPNPFGNGHTFIKVPSPFEVGFLFKTIPEAAVRYAYGTSTGREMIASYAHGLASNLPGGSIPPISVIPQAVKPIIETVANYSFFTGRPIEGMNDQQLPVAARGEHASELAKILSSAGLDKTGLSPIKIDYLIQSYMAELGTFSTSMASNAIYAAQGKTKPASNIEELPFNKAFMTNPNSSKAVADFFELEHNAQEMVRYFNNLKASGDVEGMKKLLEDEQNNKMRASAPALRNIGTKLTELKKAMVFYKTNQDIDPEVRRQKINELNAIYDQVAAQGVKISDSLGINR